jgi:MFS transporter, DHA2 family, triacylglyceride efflux pump
VGFAAADTYVVVLALPDMMSSVGLNLDQLQRAAPIVSGFLLGYIAMLPLIGRIADLQGRIPVLVGSLLMFSFGSLVTAASYDLTSMVIGRFLQGVGGGGLVPATLALVADIWSVERRGMPLGVVGAVQELGSVLGPLYGAGVLAVSTWKTIFWLNLGAGLLLAFALLCLRHLDEPSDRSNARSRFAGTLGRWDWLGGALAVAAASALALVMAEPERLTSGVTTGLAFVPYLGDSRWTTPLAAACYIVSGLFVVRECTARRPLVNIRGAGALTSSADLLGAGLLAVALGGVVLAFATADPKVQVVSARGTGFLLVSAVATAVFIWRQRRAAASLIPRHALTARAAWGSLVVSFFVGSALIAALVDIPVFARVTVYQSSQLGAALVLVRLLVALPVGALVGGYLLRRVPVVYLAAGGMTLVAAAFVSMTRWDLQSLHGGTSTAALVVCGFGFGLAIAPVNAALLAASSTEVHGVASALLVVARMMGMLVGISALTTIGLRRFYAASAAVPPVGQVCDSQRLCDAYVLMLKEAGIAQLHAIFFGAAVCAAIAVLLTMLLLRSAAGRSERAVGALRG